MFPVRCALPAVTALFTIVPGKHAHIAHSELCGLPYSQREQAGLLGGHVATQGPWLALINRYHPFAAYCLFVSGLTRLSRVKTVRSAALPTGLLKGGVGEEACSATGSQRRNEITAPFQRR